MEELWWWPHEVKTPYIHELKKHENNVILFDGYFRLEDATMPVRRIVFMHKEPFLIEITEKKTLQDTSEYGDYDEEYGVHICHTPTDLIELRYKLIQHIKTNEELELLQKEIIAEEDRVCERNELLRDAREKKEYEELMKTYSYTPFTSNIPPLPDSPREEFHEEQEPSIHS